MHCRYHFRSILYPARWSTVAIIILLFHLACYAATPHQPAVLARAAAIAPPGTASTPSAAHKPGASTSRSAQPGPDHATPLTGDARLLLVLNRFTYGPRPGDLDHLRQMGMQAWFNQQLNPASIDDSSLDIRLADYPAMQLTIPELMRRYPDQPVIRKVINGVMPAPSGLAEKAIYANQIARYEAKSKDRGQPGTMPKGVVESVIQPEAQSMMQPTPSQGESAQLGSGESPALAGAPAASLPFTSAALTAMTPEARFQAICSLSPAQQKAMRDTLPPPDRARLTAGFTPLELEQFAALERPSAVVAAEAVQTKLLRDIDSERQLNEIMTDFWLNHFNVYLRKNQFAPYYIAAYARDTIRPRALGHFEDLLVATASSPAMLSYLDNASSTGPHSLFATRQNGRVAADSQPSARREIGLNENYARELMELHTLGVDGGYTQHDVTEVAKVFTGWTLGDPAQPRGGLPVQAEFNESKHEPGTKLVLGHTIKPNGEREGLEVLHLLATSPSTARFISSKLAVRFVSDDPPPAMVDRMAKTFLTSNGDIRQVLLAMVDSPEFFTSATAHAKVKTPVDFVVSAVRASGAEVESTGALAHVITELGMPVYGMQTPNGYSMQSEPWNNTASLVARLNFALALSTNRVMGVHVDWDRVLAAEGTGDGTPPQRSGPAQEELLERTLLHAAASAQTRQAVLAQVTADPAEQQASLRQVAIESRAGDPLAIARTPPAGTEATRPAVGVNPRVAQRPLDIQTALAAGLLFGSPEFQRR